MRFCNKMVKADEKREDAPERKRNRERYTAKHKKIC